MKQCPFCAEEIKDEAIRCRYCNMMLNAPSSDGPTPATAAPDPFDEDAGRITRTNLNPGIKIGDRYLINFQLGEGGMGEVYLTQDTLLDGAMRAIKVLPDRLVEDLNAVNRLREEARLAMELNHSGIVRLYNYENSGKVHYLVMEYVNGIDLNTYIGVGKKVSEKEARRIGVDIAEALRVPHEHLPPVAHRDIKPSNILLEWPKLDIEKVKAKGNKLTPEDFPDIETAKIRLTDFGIARQVRDGMSKYKQETETSGTQQYMSPEQIRGERCRHPDGLIFGGGDIV